MPIIKIDNKVQTEQTAINYINDSLNSFALRNKRDRAQLNQDFVRGNQWSEEQYNLYKSKGVNPVTINRCRPAVKGLVGMQIQDSQEIRVRPRKDATESAAQAWTEVLKHSQDMAKAEFKYTEWFYRGSVDPEAFLFVQNDKTQNVNGQPVFKVKSQMDVDVDPNAPEYDIDESAEFVIVKEWVSIDWLEAKFPDKIQQIRGALAIDPGSPGGKDSHVERIAQWASDAGTTFIHDDEFGNDENDKYLRDRYRYRIYYVYYKEPVEGMLVTDNRTGVIKQISDAKLMKKFRTQARKSDRFEVSEHPIKKLHESMMLGNVMELEHNAQPFGSQLNIHPVFRFSTYWDNGYANAFLDDIVQLNQEENIHRTQDIRILNQMANSGWKTKGGSKAKKKELANYGAVEGIVIDESEYAGGVDKIKPNVGSPAHFARSLQFGEDVQWVSGIDDASLGLQTKGTESGRAKFLQQTQNKRSSEIIISHNFFHSLELVGRFLLKFIRKNNIYTDAEIRQVVAESSLIDEKLLDRARRQFQQRTGAELPSPEALPPITPEMLDAVRPEDQTEFMETVRSGTEAATRYLKEFPRLQANFDEIIKEEAIEMLLSELRSDAQAEYGIKVVLSSSSPTTRMSTLAELDAIQEKYGIIPPDVFIDATDIDPATKELIKSNIQAQRQAQPVGGAA